MDQMDVVEQMYRRMNRAARGLQTQVDVLSARRLRAETSGGVVASTLATAPLAASGGMSNGSEYIDLRWISDGRKPGELAGAGTGVLAYYNAAVDQWWGVHNYAAVTT